MRRLLEYPTWALLAVLIAVSASLRTWAGLTVPTPWIAPDELIYGELGRSLWQTGHLALLGRPTRFFSFVYPAFVRLQALVLLPAYATAVLVDASFARRPRRVLRHLPAAGGIVLLALVWSGWQLRHGGPFAKVLGGYEAAAETNYAVGAAARFVLYHLGDLVLISGVIPFCALLLLVVRAVTSREEDKNIRAF